MKNTIWYHLRSIRTSKHKTCILLCILMFSSCIHKSPGPNIAAHDFEYNGKKYRIRSISANDDALSYNELMSKKIVAKDYDRDGFIDEITLGEASLSEAQQIYDHILVKLLEQNRLRQINAKSNAYRYENSEYNYEIKSFNSIKSRPFNEFKLVQSKQMFSTEITIGIDHNADGTLDEIIKGRMSLQKIQSLYQEVLKEGLERNQLIEREGKILVK